MSANTGFTVILQRGNHEQSHVITDYIVFITHHVQLYKDITRFYNESHFQPPDMKD